MNDERGSFPVAGVAGRIPLVPICHDLRRGPEVAAQVVRWEILFVRGKLVLYAEDAASVRILGMLFFERHLPVVTDHRFEFAAQRVAIDPVDHEAPEFKLIYYRSLNCMLSL